MFCSTVIPTIARDTLSRAVCSVLAQEFPSADFEIIVVNDSGKPLPKEDWQDSARVKVIDTQRRERIVARNTGAALARGTYIHFLDDDDWLLPDAIERFYQLASRTEAHWLYGSSQLVDRSGMDLIQLKHSMNGNCFVQVMAGEWIPLQSSLILAKAFFAVGGFTPNVFVTQDIDLCRRIALRGDLAGIPDLVSCIGMGAEKSTTQYDLAPQYSRLAREIILNQSGVWSRLQGSARSSEWQGRIPRVYLTSMLWNLREKRFFTALSRFVFGCAAFIIAGKHLFSPVFWKALSRPYNSPTFQRGFEEAQLPVMTR
jgi:glycosyltransferase involved in cell wall biosynthesis